MGGYAHFISTLLIMLTFGSQATWYTPGLGACGATSDKTALVVAVSSDIFQQDLCWKVR